MNDIFRSVFVVPDLRKRVLVTLAMLAVYRIGVHIPTPGTDIIELQEMFQAAEGTALGLIDMFTGGQLERVSIFALGLGPYITAAGIVQLLAFFWPYLRRFSKEGELGRRKITLGTRYFAIVIAVVGSAGIATSLQGSGLVYDPGIGFLLMTIVTMTMGAVFLMWLGDQITEHGIGNGMALILVTGILVGMPSAFQNVYENVVYTDQWNLFGVEPILPAHRVLSLILILGAMLAVVALVVLVERGAQHVPVRFAQGVPGRRIGGGRLTHLPLRLNPAGVIPVAFASSALAFPQTLALIWQDDPGLMAVLDSLTYGEPLYELLYAGAIVLFTLLYTAAVFHPDDVAETLSKYGGFIPGVGSGQAAVDRIGRIQTKATLIGGLYLALIALIPDFLLAGIRLHHVPWIGDWAERTLPLWFLEGLNVNFYFGGLAGDRSPGGAGNDRSNQGALGSGGRVAREVRPGARATGCNDRAVCWVAAGVRGNPVRCEE